jgi:hypothetical protein
MEADGNDEDKIIVRSNGTVTYTGKDIAYQLWKLGHLDRDFRYRRYRLYGDGHVLWSTTSEAGESGAPVFGHARAVYKRPFRRGLCIADARHIVDVAINPLQDCHYPRHTVAGFSELALRKPHELVRGTKPAWQEKGQNTVR